MSLFKSPFGRWVVGGLGTLLIGVLLVVHTAKDISKEVDAWYFHSTWIWLIVMIMGSIIFWIQYGRLERSGINVKELFNELPEE